jgi:hypothetical protein
MDTSTKISPVGAAKNEKGGDGKTVNPKVRQNPVLLRIVSFRGNEKKACQDVETKRAAIWLLFLLNA